MNPKGNIFGSPKPRSPFAFGKSTTYESSLTTRGSPQVERDLPSGIIPFNASLPVQVVEALAGTDTAHISCKLDSSGWAWLIKNRTLYVWKYLPSPLKTLSCTELKLSSTELYHKADLTCIVQIPVPSSYTPKQSTSVAVMNISPEGIVRYWPSLSNPGLFIETSAGLNGKECHGMTPIKPFGCILITTTNDILLLSPSQSTVSCRQLHMPVGMLSGISRRVSSFLLGSSVAHDSLHLPKITSCNAVGSPDKSSKKFYVWASGSLHKWELSPGSSISERLLFQADVMTLLKDEAARSLRIQSSSILRVEPLDLCSTGNGVALIAGVVLPAISGVKIIVVFGSLECSGQCVPTNFSYFASLQPECYAETEEDIPDFKLMVPIGLYRGFIYKSDTITSVPVTEVAEECFTVYPPGKDIIGAGFTGTMPIFLSRRNGFLTMTIAARDSTMSSSQLNITQSSLATTGRDVSMERTDVAKTLQFGAFDGEEDFNMLAQGFCEYAEGNVFEAQEMVAELTLGYNVDKSALKMSKDIVDSIPASDPRWADTEGLTGSLKGLSPSVIIMNQLQDKEKYHAMFVKYLQDVDLWDKLSKYTFSGQSYSTKRALLQNAEKVRASMILQELYQSHSELLERAFTVTAGQLGEDESYSLELTNQDKVFQKVSKIEQLFVAIASVQDDNIKSAQSFKEEVQTVAAVNTIFTEPLKEALLIRKTWARILEDDSTSDASYSVWTSTGGRDGLRTILRNQVVLTVEKLLPNADSTKTGSLLAQQAFDLADLLLEGYQSELNVTRDIALEEAFRTDRKRILTCLVHEGYYEISLELAERYRDFTTLIALCEQRNDTERMDHYKSTYGDLGFLDQLYQWYIDKGDWQKLLNQESTSCLEKFLSSHHQLRWLNQIGNREFAKASSTLFELASQEKDLLSRKKTMLSISKLCLLASSQDADIVHSKADEIERALALIQLQETLPEEVAIKAKLDPVKMPPLSVEYLIELYTGESNASPDVYDFRRALEMVSYLEEDMVTETRLKIWSRAILHDHCWKEQVVMDPVTVVSQTFFGQCVKSLLEGDSTGIIPSIDILTSLPDLEKADLTANTNFLFLLKAFYECHEL